MALILSGALRSAENGGAASHGRVHALKITILSTMLADGAELGEWGFSALVEADGHRILFDTGAHNLFDCPGAKNFAMLIRIMPGKKTLSVNSHIIEIMRRIRIEMILRRLNNLFFCPREKRSL